MEVEKKFKCALKKTKYMIVKTGKKEEVITVKVKGGVIQKTEKYKYFGKTMKWARQFKVT